jgi:hypothetical protein
MIVTLTPPPPMVAKFQLVESVAVMTMRQNILQRRRNAAIAALLTGDAWQLGMSMTFGGVASRLPVFD